MPDTRLRQRAPMAVIRLARRTLANTPVHQLRTVGWLYRKAVHIAWGGGEITTEFRGLRLTVPGGGDYVLVSALSSPPAAGPSSTSARTSASTPASAPPTCPPGAG